MTEQKEAVAAVPASYAQQRLWFVHESSADRAALNLSGGVAIEGDLDDAGLVAAVEAVLARHEVLRSGFRMIDGRLYQVISPHGARVRTVDVRDEASDEALDRVVRAEADTPFDLGRGPLVRVSLARTGETSRALHLAVHHIVVDAWSLGLLVREVGEALRAVSAGRPWRPPAIELQYADYAAWQEQLADSGALEPHLDFWRDRLRGMRPLDLPTDHPRSRHAPIRVDSVHREIDGTTADALRAAGRAAGGDLFTALLATFCATLSRTLGTADLVVGSTVAGRTQPQTQDMVGLFANMVAVRTGVDEAAGFAGLARTTATAWADAYQHQDVPFDQVVALVNDERDTGRHPLFPVLFQMIPRQEPLEVPGLDISFLPAPGRPSALDLLVSVVDEGGRLSVSMEYRSELHDARTIARTADQWLDLTDRLLAEPDRPLGTFPLQRWAGDGERTTLTEPDMRASTPSPAAGLPDTDLLKEALQVWHEVLPGATAEPDTNFFVAGGSSLQVMVLLSKVDASCGVQVSLERFIEDPTPAHLAAQIGALRATADEGEALLEDVLAGLEEERGTGDRKVTP
ncbi:condensation domain-containing protein [Streptomyces sp. NPDC001093]|uniref:condensation domain-containing protein n=1 Tax=Streptomyces sp. NPDC001093 TaxID=3154376 RepID=UPI003321B914